MTDKEKAIQGFITAMRNADVMHMATYGNFTPNMAMYWEQYKEACMKEVQDGRSKK